MIEHVHKHRDIYEPYVDYHLVGTYDRYLSLAIRTVLGIRVEVPTGNVEHIHVLDPVEYPLVGMLPIDMSIRVSRPLYELHRALYDLGYGSHLMGSRKPRG